MDEPVDPPATLPEIDPPPAAPLLPTSSSPVLADPARDPMSSLHSKNDEARISTFAMSDGPLRVDLAVYDGVCLKSLVKDLLAVVREQGETIQRCVQVIIMLCSSPACPI